MPLEVSFVCPAYNEGQHIHELLNTWIQFLNTQKSNGAPLQYEIVICNDGSKDSTKSEILKACQIHPQIRLVDLSKNQGAGYAMASAIRASVGDIVVTTDSDGQFRIDDAFTFFRKLQAQPHLDAISGIRQKKIDSFGARFGTRISSLIANFIFGSRFQDFNCALKAVRGTWARRFPYEAKGLNYSTELSFWIHLGGLRWEEETVIQYNRQSGISSVRFFKTARDRLLYLFYLWIKLKLKHHRILSPLGDPL